ncbi:MAG: Blp family class II bacteriocin [Vagococcus sp.]|uniref:Blp family class II bacteriocin n=1 Tax=Vagococcus TaxID=2737 RepID=UPI002FCB3EF4
MKKTTELNIQELQKISGGGCVGQVLGGAAMGAVKGGIGLSAIPAFGTIEGAVFGANVGAVAGGLKCLADNL